MVIPALLFVAEKKEENEMKEEKEVWGLCFAGADAGFQITPS